MATPVIYSVKNQAPPVLRRLELAMTRKVCRWTHGRQLTENERESVQSKGNKSRKSGHWGVLMTGNKWEAESRWVREAAAWWRTVEQEMKLGVTGTPTRAPHLLNGKLAAVVYYFLISRKKCKREKQIAFQNSKPWCHLPHIAKPYLRFCSRSMNLLVIRWKVWGENYRVTSRLFTVFVFSMAKAQAVCPVYFLQRRITYC